MVLSTDSSFRRIVVSNQVLPQDHKVNDSLGPSISFSGQSPSKGVPSAILRANVLGQSSAVKFGTNNFHFTLKDEVKNLADAKVTVAKTKEELEKWNNKIGLYALGGGTLGGTLGGVGTVMSGGLDAGVFTYLGITVGSGVTGSMANWWYSGSLREAEEKHAKAQATYDVHDERIKGAKKELAKLTALLTTARLTALTQKNHQLAGKIYMFAIEIKKALEDSANSESPKKLSEIQAFKALGELFNKPELKDFNALLSELPRVEKEGEMELKELLDCFTVYPQELKLGDDGLPLGLDWDALKNARNSTCKDVRKKLIENFNHEMMLLYPNNYTHIYRSRIGKFDNLVEQMDTLAHVIQDPIIIATTSLIEKRKAIQKFHLLEKEYNQMGDKPHSREFFRMLLLDPDAIDIVRATILEEMADFPSLRFPEEEMKLYLEQHIGKEKMAVEVKCALLDLVEATAYPSSTLNFHLKMLQRNLSSKIDGVKSPAPDLVKLAEKVNGVLAARQEKGLYKVVNIDRVAEELANTLVGNPNLKDTLLDCLDRYEDVVLNPNKKNPALKLWLSGQPGIGKTLLVERFHHILHGTDQGLIVFKLAGENSTKGIIDKLKSHSPLQGKTIFFDEFQELDEFNESEQGALIAFLKQLISPDPNDSKLIYDNYGLDFQGAVVAFASNSQASEIKALTKNATAKSLLDRFDYVKTIKLNEDLRPHVEEIVTQFGPKQLYLKDFQDLGARIQLKPDAQQYLLSQIQDHLATLDENKPVSGRSVTAKIGQALQSAIARTQRESKQLFPLDNNGDIDYPLVFYMADNRLMAEPPLVNDISQE